VLCTAAILSFKNLFPAAIEETGACQPAPFLAAEEVSRFAKPTLAEKSMQEPCRKEFDPREGLSVLVLGSSTASVISKSGKM